MGEGAGEFCAAREIPADPWRGGLPLLRHPHLPRRMAGLLLSFAGGEGYFLPLTPARGAASFFQPQPSPLERGEIAADPNRRLFRDALRLGQSLEERREKMNWPELWMWLALLYLVLWHATKRFQWSGDTVLAFVIYTVTIADRIWWLFLVQIVLERVSVYVAEVGRLKKGLAREEGLETVFNLLKKRRYVALNQVVNDEATIDKFHPDFSFHRNTKRWYAALSFLFQVGAYFVIQELRRPGYLRTFFIR